MIVLNLCAPCQHIALNPTYLDSWIEVPKLCPECGAKVMQIVRLMIAGGKVVMPVQGV